MPIWMSVLDHPVPVARATREYAVACQANGGSTGIRKSPIVPKRILALIVVPAVMLLASGPAAAQIPTNSKWESSSVMAQWTSPGTNFLVRNNMWNCQHDPDPCAPETVWARSYHDWGVQTNQPAGNTAVLSYPDVQDVLTQASGNDTPLGRFTILKSTFSIRMPSGLGLDDEAAYDDWLNNWNTEVMIWVYNQGQTPAGSVVSRPVIAGQHWAFWASGTKGNDHNIYSFVLNTNETRGSVNTLAMLDWLVKQGWVPANSGVTDNEFGMEECSSGGHTVDFAVTGFTLTARTS